MRRGNRRPWAALATLGVLFAAYFPLLQQYAVELQTAGSAAYAAVLGLASTLLLYRTWQGSTPVCNGFRAVAILLTAMLLLAMALACAVPWLAAVSASMAVVAMVDWSGGSRLFFAAWQLLLVGAFSILLPLNFISVGIERANQILLLAGRTLLERWGTICLIDGDVLELHHGRLDPAQGYFNLTLGIAMISACLVFANLRRRGPIHSLILAALAPAWLWLVCTVQLLALASVIEGNLPLANEPATLVPITIAAATVFLVLVISTDYALELFPQLIFNANTAPPALVTPAPAMLSDHSAIAHYFSAFRVARLLWYGLLLLSAAIAIEQVAFDGHYLVASHVVGKVAEESICDASLLPKQWGDWRCTSFCRVRDASCLGRSAVLPAWHYETPHDALTVSLFVSPLNRSGASTSSPLTSSPPDAPRQETSPGKDPGDARPELTSSPDADPAKTEPVFAWQSIATENRREATLLTLIAPLELSGDSVLRQPADYLAANCPPGFTDWLAGWCQHACRKPLGLSMLLKAYRTWDVAEDSQVHGFFRTVLASARAAQEQSEVLP